MPTPLSNSLQPSTIRADATALSCIHPGHSTWNRQVVKLKHAAQNVLSRVTSSHAANDDLRSLQLVCISKDGGGDKNQAFGIAAAIKSRAEARGAPTVSIQSVYVAEDDSIKTKALPLSSGDLYMKNGRNNIYLTELNSLTQQAERTCFIVAGASTPATIALAQVPHDQRCMTILSAHQLNPVLLTLPCLPDIVALPDTSVRSLKQSSLHIATDLFLGDGVAHNFTPESIECDTQTYNTKNPDKPIPAIGPNTVTVVLPGDAQDENGKMKLFTEQDARELARRLVAFEHGLRSDEQPIHWLVTNGPRTGNHDYAGSTLSAVENPHRQGVQDHVTTAFLDELSLLNQETVDCFDFQFDKLPSALKPLVRAYQTAEGPVGNFHLPGESISMVSEVTDYLGNVVVNEVPCMNHNHQNNLDAVFKNNRVDVLPENGELKARIMVKRPDPSQQVSAQIADKAMRYLSDMPLRNET